jgi:DNA repair photolyase
VSRPRYEEVECRQALNRVAGMPFKWSLNPYRGCVHGCHYCLTPETPILYADLSWRPIGDVKVGDELVGFDEEPTESGYRYFRPSVVQAVWWSKRATRRIVTDKGEVNTTADHRWLRNGRAWWVRTRNLRVGSVLRHLSIDQPADVAGEGYRAGYIAGLTAGDGTFRYQPGQRSNRLGYPMPYWRVALADSEPLLRLVEYLADQLRFFQRCRPAIARKHTSLWNRALRLESARVEAIEGGPEREVVDIQTSTHTFFAAGLATHNCFARPTHAYLQLGIGADFSGIIWVKRNVAAVLAGEVGRRGWKRDEVAIGTATDPYQPVEGIHRLTRQCLEVLARYRTPASIVTKGTLILRDIDVLVELADRGGLTVCHSVPTVDEEIWRRTEPGTPPPRQRLKALERLRQRGIRAGVLMAPLLPGLSATPARIEATVRAAAEHGASFVGANVLHLGPGVREHYLAFVEEQYPRLVGEYARLYPGKYAPKRLQEELAARVKLLRGTYGVGERYGAPRRPEPAPEQLRLEM